MEQKTQVRAEAGRQEILIIREFDIPLDLLFKAYTEPEFIEQWMENKVLQFDKQDQGGYRFRKEDADGNVIFAAYGVIHTFNNNKRIVRTFEMENTPFGVQLEYMDFEALDSERSLLRNRTVFETIEKRDSLLKLPFAMGLNMAHARLETILKTK